MAASPVQVPRDDRCRTGYAEGKAGIRQDGPASWPDGRLGPVGRASNTTEAFDVLVGNDAVRTPLDAIFGPGPVAPRPTSGAKIRSKGP